MNLSAKHELLVDQIIIQLSSTGLCRVWRQPTGAAFRNNKLVRYGLVGSADISGILINGKRIEIEVKTGRGVQNPSQVSFQKVIEAFGGIYILARDVETVVQRIKAAANV